MKFWQQFEIYYHMLVASFEPIGRVTSVLGSENLPKSFEKQLNQKELKYGKKYINQFSVKHLIYFDSEKQKK